jgi:hypothetical protein
MSCPETAHGVLPEANETWTDLCMWSVSKNQIYGRRGLGIFSLPAPAEGGPWAGLTYCFEPFWLRIRRHTEAIRGHPDQRLNICGGERHRQFPVQSDLSNIPDFSIRQSAPVEFVVDADVDLALLQGDAAWCGRHPTRRRTEIENFRAKIREQVFDLRRPPPAVPPT